MYIRHISNKKSIYSVTFNIFYMAERKRIKIVALGLCTVKHTL